jgi:MinD-like ATPase involved in chromosome partitioning or flagellar assembly
MPAVAAVYAAKGGTGKTTFLLHLAARLAKEGQRVCVLDMDLVFGTVATLLNIEPRKSIVDLLRRIDDPKASRACLLLTESGFFVVAAPSQPGRFQMDAVHLHALLRFLKEETDLVLIDTPNTFDSLTRQVLEASDQLFLMTTDEPASLLNLERIRPLLASLHPSPESWLVWNRLTAPAPRELWKERLPWPSVLELPEDSTVNSAMRRGEWIPVSPASPYRVQIGRIVDQWLGKETESSGLGKKRFFKRWPFK